MTCWRTCGASTVLNVMNDVNVNVNTRLAVDGLGFALCHVCASLASRQFLTRATCRLAIRMNPLHFTSC